MSRPPLKKASKRVKLTVGYNPTEREDCDRAASRVSRTRARFIREASLYCATLINAAETGAKPPQWPFGAPSPAILGIPVDRGSKVVP